MKLTLQVLLHVLCGLAGFWIAAPADDALSPETPPSLTTQNSAEANLPSPLAQPLDSSPTDLEARVALLTPENYWDTMQPISQMRLDELPAMLRGLLRNPFPEVRWRRLNDLFKHWATLDLRGALAAMRGISSPQPKQHALGAILSFWTETDADAAWLYVTTLEDDSVLQEWGIERMLSIIGRKDPLHYAAWADQIEDVFLRERALRSIGDAWMNDDPKGAFAALTTVEPERLRDYLLSRVCYRDGIDHAAGLEIVSQLPIQAERSRLSEEWLSAYVNDKPHEAYQWLLSHADRPELQKSAETIGGHLGATVKNFAELRTYAQQLPLGPLRDAFAARAADEWASAGRPLAEAEYLLSLCGPCLERDSAQSTIDDLRTKAE